MKHLKSNIFQKILTYNHKNQRALCLAFLLLTAMTAACGGERADLQETLNKGTLYSELAKTGEEASENCIEMFSGRNEGITDKEGDPEVSNKEEETGESEETSVVANKSLAIDQIRKMDAGTILDISQIEGKRTDLLFYSEVPGTEVQERILGVSYQENDISPWMSCAICAFCIWELTGRRISGSCLSTSPSRTRCWKLCASSMRMIM